MTARRIIHARTRWRTPLRRVCTVSLVAASTLVPASGLVAAQEAPVAQSATLVAGEVTGLSQGDRGSAVKALQQALLDAGVTVAGGADGIFGPATKAAVTAFQAARGLPQTGSVDAATADLLATTTSATTTESSDSSGSTGSFADLAAGDSGDLVRALQEKLIDFGVYLSTGANGTWGSVTTRGLTQFQRWNGLTPTGTMNTATVKRLGLDGSASTVASTTTATTTAPTATTTTSSNPYVGLAQGARGDRVAELQKALQSTGLVVRGGADGIFGSATATALKAFQGFNGLTQNGIVSERAAELLGLGTSTSTTTPPAATSPYLGLKVGSQGQLVKDVQQALINAGVTVRGGADGAFGNATKTALTSYQSSVGINADGTVNQGTIDALKLGTSGTPTPFSGSTTDSGSNDTGSTTSGYVGLRQGSNGPLVVDLQEALLDMGLVISGGADGVFGSDTTRALKAFQSVNGIAQTGIVTERGARLMALGSSTSTSNTSFELERFPVQGLCFFGDTWHAPRGGGRLHVGTDVIAAEGKLLYAVADGEITKFFWDQPGALSGNGIRLTQPNGTYFIYLHMLGFAPGIEVGTKVTAGDVIGWVGNTGSSATAHLHFEIHPNGGDAINPYPYMKAIDGCKNTTPQYQSSFL